MQKKTKILKIEQQPKEMAERHQVEISALTCGVRKSLPKGHSWTGHGIVALEQLDCTQELMLEWMLIEGSHFQIISMGTFLVAEFTQSLCMFSWFLTKSLPEWNVNGTTKPQLFRESWKYWKLKSPSSWKYWKYDFLFSRFFFTKKDARRNFTQNPPINEPRSLTWDRFEAKN